MTRRYFGAGEQVSGTNTFFLRDHLGSIREVTDDSGSVRARYEYDPYGRRTNVSGDLDSDFGFTGHFFHANSGLCLTLYRAYDPDTGRWISKDPIAEEGGINLYAYVSNSPISFVDLLGLGEWEFKIEPGDKRFWPGPMIEVSYTVDKNQAACCEAYEIRRYAKPRYFGALIPGPWRRDETGKAGTIGNSYTGAPSTAEPDEPGQRPPLFGYLVPLVVTFRWEVVCIRGPAKGKVISSIEQTLVII